MGEWINKVRHIHIRRCYAAIKWNKALINAKTWTNLGNIVLSEGSGSHPTTVVCSHFCEMSRIGNSVETDS